MNTKIFVAGIINIWNYRLAIDLYYVLKKGQQQRITK